FSTKLKGFFKYLRVKQIRKEICHIQIISKFLFKGCKVFVKVNRSNMFTRTFSIWLFIFQDNFLQLFWETTFRLTQFSGKKLLHRFWERYSFTLSHDIFWSKVVGNHKLSHIAYYF